MDRFLEVVGGKSAPLMNNTSQTGKALKMMTWHMGNAHMNEYEFLGMVETPTCRHRSAGDTFGSHKEIECRKL